MSMTKREKVLAAATVLVPADMREAIIERLQAAWQTLQ